MKLLKGTLALSLLTPSASAQADPTAAPAGAKAVLRLTGVGVQIYTCTSTAAGPAWTFVAPQAKLLDQTTEAGIHGAGPMWTLKDGSSVKGQVVGTKPSPDADAIPWLLLKALGPKGPGALAQVAYIRRSDTSGGKAHAVGCDAAHLGATDRVPYTATYTFYVGAE
jgi:hypothetical protein